MNRFRLTMFATTLAALTACSNAQTIQVNKENRTIAVTATDKVTVMADQATVHIGFIAYGPDSNAAYSTGSWTSNVIVKALKGVGVPAEAIQSENQQVAPVQPYQVEKLTPAERAQRQFQVTQSWIVKTSADNAAKVLDAAVKAGANQSGQIEWGIKDDNAAQAEAAAKALKRAKGQAEQMAAGLDAKLGALLYASNEVQVPPRPIMRESTGAFSMAKSVEPLAINPREIEKFATVYAVFAIE